MSRVFMEEKLDIGAYEFGLPEVEKSRKMTARRTIIEQGKLEKYKFLLETSTPQQFFVVSLNGIPTKKYLAPPFDYIANKSEVIKGKAYIEARGSLQILGAQIIRSE